MSPSRSRTSNKLHKKRRGAAAVEFAVVAPLFLLLLAGIIEFGQVFRIEHHLSTASRRAARTAMFNGAETTAVAAMVEERVEDMTGIDPSQITVEIAVNGDPEINLNQAQTGDEISVTVSVPYAEAGLGFFATFFSNATLSANCFFERE